MSLHPDDSAALEVPPPPYSTASHDPADSRGGPSAPGARPSNARADRDDFRPALDGIPIDLLYRILSLTLDPRAVPARYIVDVEEERARRRLWMFLGLRAVNRRLYLVSTAILRDLYLPLWRAGVIESTDPLAAAHDERGGLFAGRRREAAVLDRFVAVRAGEDLRARESSFAETTGGTDVLKLQPAARIEDLLLALPRSLVVPSSSALALASASGRFPLPHDRLAVQLSPTWATLVLLPARERGRPARGAKEVVVEVRRRDAERTVARFGEALEDISRGLERWGARAG